MRSSVSTTVNHPLRGAAALIAAVVYLSCPAAWSAERLPTPADVARIRVEQPLPGKEALDKVGPKNTEDTARALRQAQHQSSGDGRAATPGLPVLSDKPEGVDVRALVEKHYNSHRPSFEGGQKTTPGLLYFASFSVPEASLDRTIDQAEKSGAALVLRGLVKGGDFRATAERLGKLLKGRRVSFLIDPTLFTRFEIERVPTVVLISDGEVPRCEDQACNAPVPPHWAIAGDVSIDYALEAIVRQAPEAASTAQPYLAALRGGFHEGR